LATIVKDEAPYILEWLAYHMAIGVDKFIIADNNSSDGTKEILVNLNRKGLIDLIHYKGYKNKPPQLLAFAEFLRNTKGIDWLAFIDADEFISFNPDLKLKKILYKFSKNTDIGAVGLNWAIYGSSGKVEQEDGLVIERFKYRAFQSFISNHHIKSIIRVGYVGSVGSNPHKFYLKRNKKYVYSNGEPLFDHSILGEGNSEKIVWNPFRLNHYMLKSKNEYEHRARRPRVSSLEKNFKDEVFFNNHDCNNLHEEIDSKFLSKIKSIMNSLALIVKNFHFQDILCPVDSYSYGSIEIFSIVDNIFKISGWSYLSNGSFEESYNIKVNGYLLDIVSYKAIERNDIHSLSNLFPSFCGFELSCDLQDLNDFISDDIFSIELIIVRGDQFLRLNDIPTFVDLNVIPCNFNVDNYLKLNPDLVEANVDPIAHYLEYGRFENRSYL